MTKKEAYEYRKNESVNDRVRYLVKSGKMSQLAGEQYFREQREVEHEKEVKKPLKLNKAEEYIFIKEDEYNKKQQELKNLEDPERAERKRKIEFEREKQNRKYRRKKKLNEFFRKIKHKSNLEKAAELGALRRQRFREKMREEEKREQAEMQSKAEHEAEQERKRQEQLEELKLLKMSSEINYKRLKEGLLSTRLKEIKDKAEYETHTY